MKKFNVGIKAVVRRKDGGVLLLKKNNQESFWEVPGGRVDDDESIEETLMRELQEELPGISRIHVNRILCADRLPKDIAEDLGLILIYYEVFCVLPVPIQISREHSEFKWIKSLDEIALNGGTLKALTAAFKK